MAYERVKPQSGLKWLRFQVGIFSYLLFVWLEMRSFKGTLRSNQNSHLQKWRIYPKQCILSHGGLNRYRVGVKLTVYHIDCSGGWRIWSHSSAVHSEHFILHVTCWGFFFHRRGYPMFLGCTGCTVPQVFGVIPELHLGHRLGLIGAGLLTLLPLLRQKKHRETGLDPFHA